MVAINCRDQGAARRPPIPFAQSDALCQVSDHTQRPPDPPARRSATVIETVSPPREIATTLMRPWCCSWNVRRSSCYRAHCWDVLLRLRDANARILTGAPVVSIEGDTILCRSGQSTVCHTAGDMIVLAIGPRPLRDVAQLAEDARE
jgi:hypothetical protein